MKDWRQLRARLRLALTASVLNTAVGRTAAAAVFGLVVTVIVSVSPALRLAYRSPEGHLVLETAVALIGALLALLLYGRFRRSGALQELLMVHALAVLAVSALFFVAIPLVVGATATSAITTWAPLLARLVGAVLILTAALVPERRVVSGVRLRNQTLVVVALLVGLALTVEMLSAALPTAVTQLPPPELSARPVIDGHAVLIGAQVVNLLCFAIASVAFTAQAARTGDELIGWLAAASALGVWARVNYLLFPSLYSEWLYTGDFLRLGFYLLLLVGAVREVHAYWNAQAEAAAFAERRRLARDLHDGAVQELGYLRNEARHIRDEDLRARVTAASERALDEARRALAALVAPTSEPLGSAVRRAVEEIGDRYDVPIRVVDESEDECPPDNDREALVRIAREAVLNAVRHGKPNTVRVTVRHRELLIEDDGKGFVARDGGAAHRGFGLQSMQDRTEGLGGTFAIDSVPGHGTTVLVIW